MLNTKSQCVAVSLTQRGDSSAVYRTVYMSLLDPSAMVEVDSTPVLQRNESISRQNARICGYRTVVRAHRLPYMLAQPACISHTAWLVANVDVFTVSKLILWVSRLETNPPHIVTHQMANQAGLPVCNASFSDTLVRRLVSVYSNIRNF